MNIVSENVARIIMDYSGNENWIFHCAYMKNDMKLNCNINCDK